MYRIVIAAAAAIIPWIYAIWLLKGLYRTCRNEVRSREKQEKSPADYRSSAPANSASAPSPGGFGWLDNRCSQGKRRVRADAWGPWGIGNGPRTTNQVRAAP